MKTAIITGASVGIGRATAEAFLAEDFRVYILARRACPVNADGCYPADQMRFHMAAFVGDV